MIPATTLLQRLLLLAKVYLISGVMVCLMYWFVEEFFKKNELAEIWKKI